MKKIIYFTLMVMLSVTLLGPSAAEEKVKSDNRVASINEEGVKPNTQSAVESGGNVQKFSINEKTLRPIDEELLLTLSLGICKVIITSCCVTSPSNPAVGCPDLFGPGGSCVDHGLSCD